MTLEKRLDDLEDGIEEMKSMSLGLAGQTAYMQALIEQMEKCLNQYELIIEPAQPTKMSDVGLVNKFGIMRQQKQNEPGEHTLNGPRSP